MCLGKAPRQLGCPSIKLGDTNEAQETGGANMKSAKYLNMAMLAKLGWRMLSNMEELWSHVLRSKYKVKDEDGAHFREKKKCSNI